MASDMAIRRETTTKVRPVDASLCYSTNSGLTRFFNKQMKIRIQAGICLMRKSQLGLAYVLSLMLIGETN